MRCTKDRTGQGKCADLVCCMRHDQLFELPRLIAIDYNRIPGQSSLDLHTEGQRDCHGQKCLVDLARNLQQNTWHRVTNYFKMYV